MYREGGGSSIASVGCSQSSRSSLGSDTSVLGCLCLGMSSTSVVILWSSLGLLILAPASRFFWNNIVVEPHDIRVAFIGNSITFVNDLPRTMEAMSMGKITQNSCLHGGLNFMDLLKYGNGMTGRWQSSNALMDIDADYDGDEVDDGTVFYDYGACSVPQLLFGYDDILEDGAVKHNADDDNDQDDYADDDNFQYYDDGTNPCLVDPAYLQYIQAQYRYSQLSSETTDEQQSSSSSPRWDYLVMNDQTRYPAIVAKRAKSKRALADTYVPYLLETGTRPVLLMTYGYVMNSTWSNAKPYYKNEQKYYASGILLDVPTFTSLLWEGYRSYEAILRENLPSSQAPKVAPVGLAFLVLWEENRGMWHRLFYDDGFHPSPHGTFVIGCVLYATLYGTLPPHEMVEDDEVVRALWDRARGMENSGNAAMPIPTREEALYLRYVAGRVTLKGHMPKTLILDPSSTIFINYGT